MKKEIPIIRTKSEPQRDNEGFRLRAGRRDISMQACRKAADEAAAQEYGQRLAKAPLPEERPEMKACALLLEWVVQGERGMPNPDTLADAVTFARLALK